MNPKISYFGMAKLFVPDQIEFYMFVPDQIEGSTNRIVGTK